MFFIIWTTCGSKSPQGGSKFGLSFSDWPMLTQWSFIMSFIVDLWLRLRVIKFCKSLTFQRQEVWYKEVPTQDLPNFFKISPHKWKFPSPSCRVLPPCSRCPSSGTHRIQAARSLGPYRRWCHRMYCFSAVNSPLKRKFANLTLTSPSRKMFSSFRSWRYYVSLMAILGH